MPSPSEAELVAVVDRSCAKTAVNLLATPDFEIHLVNGFEAVGTPLGASRVVWLGLSADEQHCDADLEWRDAGTTPGLGARYHRHEVPSIFEKALAGQVLSTVSGDPRYDRGFAQICEQESCPPSLLLPAQTQGRTAGFLIFEFLRRPNFDDELVAALGRFADLVAHAFARAPVLFNEKEQHRWRRRQRLESLGSLAGGLAHDLNNFLQIVLTFGFFAVDAIPEDNAEARAQGQDVLDAAKRAADMTRRLLVFSRDNLSTGKTVRVAEELRRTVALSRHLLPEHIQLETQTTPSLDEAETTALDIDQAILNLLNNAVDAMPKGGSLVVQSDIEELEPDGTRPGGAHIRLAVRDRGAGMTAAQVERACDPFFTTKGPGRGTGLGLAMVHATVEKAQGRMSIDSALGTGTTVTLWLPVVAPERGDDTPPGPPPGGTECILVVEDDPLIRRIHQTIFEKAGYQVINVADGQQALGALLEHPEIDLVVSDVVMPHLGGGELAEHINRSGAPIPILFCSGYTAGALPAALLERPECAYLAKPFSPEQLLFKARALLDA